MCRVILREASIKTLLVVDLSVVASRVFFTTRDYTNVKSMIDKGIFAANATHMVICADPPEGRENNWRYKLYPQYKAQRDHNEETRQRHAFTNDAAVNLITEGYCVMMSGESEADDLVATVVTRGLQHFDRIFILSTDSDLCQLVTDKVTVLSFETTTSVNGMRHSTIVSLHPEGVQNKYGVWPEQILDFKALAGDSADNIQGCKGIAAKRAAQLIQKYNTIENMYATMDADQEWGDRLRQCEDDVRLAKRLCKLVTNVDIPTKVTLKDMRLHEAI